VSDGRFLEALYRAGSKQRVFPIEIGAMIWTGFNWLSTLFSKIYRSLKRFILIQEQTVRSQSLRAAIPASVVYYTAPKELHAFSVYNESDNIITSIKKHQTEMKVVFSSGTADCTPQLTPPVVQLY
jgi:hypothetical protein